MANFMLRPYPATAPGRMVHVAGVWDGSLLHVFLDGTDFASRKLDRPSTWFIPPTFRSCIGGFDDPDLIRRGYNFFQGRINQVRISRTARYQNPFTPQTRFEPDKDTLALYQFDEGAGDVLTDSSGNGHHGKIVGAKWVPGIAGGPTVVQRAMDNSALSIDGPGEYASFPNPYSDYRQPLTLEAWVRPAQLSTNAYFFAAPSSLTLKIQKINDPNKPEYVWQFVGYAPDGKLYGTTSRVAPAVGEWAHLAGVWEGSNLYLYVNGELHYKLAVPDGLRGPKAGEPFFTGPPPPQAQGFRGEIDEIRLSKIARYTANFTPERRFKGDANTLALYHFDEGAGDVLTDSSGNSYHGKIVNAKRVPGIAGPSSHFGLDLSAQRFQGATLWPINPSNPITVEVRATFRSLASPDQFRMIWLATDNLRLRQVNTDLSWTAIATDRFEHVPFLGLTIGRTYHIAGVSTGKALRLFVDGRRIGERPITSSLSKGPSETALGMPW